jgi:hypothetical protein
MNETVACPGCQRQLQVPEQYIGQRVQCPECQHMFVATTTAVSAHPVPTSSAPPPAESRPRSKSARYDDDEDETPRRRRDLDDDDDLDDFHHPRRLRNRFTPHRGGMIMALGLVALVGGLSLCGVPAILGPVAWALGSWDLREIREGRMDPEGASMTQAGQVCGIVATVLLILGMLFVCFAVMADMGRF